MPRLKCLRNYKKDCRQYAETHPLLAVGVFEAGNSYDLPEDLATYFQERGVFEGGAEAPPEPTENTLEI